MHWKTSNIITYLAVSAFIILYYAMIYFQISSVLEYAVFFLGLALLSTGLFIELHKRFPIKYNFRQDAEIIAASLIGGLGTFGLSAYHPGFGNSGPLGPVIAAGIVGFLGAEILERLNAKEFSAPLYCGAFVGMSSAAVFSFQAVALASFAAGFLYIAAHEIYAGIGGTLGTIAFICTAIMRKIIGG